VSDQFCEVASKISLNTKCLLAAVLFGFHLQDWQPEVTRPKKKPALPVGLTPKPSAEQKLPVKAMPQRPKEPAGPPPWMTQRPKEPPGPPPWQQGQQDCI